MKLEIVRLSLGPLPNNVYLMGDGESGDAVVIDPSYDSRFVLARAESLGWTLRQVWLTHAHFDHLAGVAEIANAFDPPLPVGLHPAGLDWYGAEGGAQQFGMSVEQPPEPAIAFVDGMQLALTPDGAPVVEVRYAPGHSPGHVMFYCEALNSLICGDVIFREGIGRTDLQDGDLDLLLSSIREKVFTLPDETRLLPGHGPESTVGHERERNPFL
ncbi:MBL fold metallo-hydrolase [bacterium]|nr:MBL fold metallo-hydrolase [bacterium]